jgi:DNA-binding transcriptional MerR regulator|tara:strand:+ start:167 stop:559 length:393 start_codon:yes stop_codon:yes gene_type:complete
MEKKSEAYKTIGEVAKMLGLINKKKGTLSTHTIRFWEKKFYQIKPKILSGKRRYYSNKEIHIIKLIKFLLKEKGMTIKGVKVMLNNPKSLILDDTTKYGVTNKSFEKEKIKGKIKKISKIVDELKELKNG